MFSICDPFFCKKILINWLQLYADEETGERKRVFEALVQYPCEFTMKIIGDPSGNFAAEIVQVVAQYFNYKTKILILWGQVYV